MSKLALDIDFLSPNGLRIFIECMKENDIEFDFGIHWKSCHKFVHFKKQEDINYIRLSGWFKKANDGQEYFDIFAAIDSGSLE